MSWWRLLPIAYMNAKQLVKLREEMGVTQRQLAELIGAQHSTVVRWETGKHQPRGGYLKALKDLEAKVKQKKRK